MWPMVSMMKHFNSIPIASVKVSPAEIEKWQFQDSRCVSRVRWQSVYAPHEHQSRRFFYRIGFIALMRATVIALFIFIDMFFSHMLWPYQLLRTTTITTTRKKYIIFKCTIIVNWWKCWPFFCVLCLDFEWIPVKCQSV